MGGGEGSCPATRAEQQKRIINMPNYRKKPVVIEARQFATDNDNGECMNAIVGWVVANGGKASHNGKTAFKVYIFFN